MPVPGVTELWFISNRLHELRISNLFSISTSNRIMMLMVNEDNGDDDGDDDSDDDDDDDDWADEK